MNKKVLVILGTTSSGKTKLAVKLAKKFNGEIISADSRQVYKGMNIGTGKDLAEYGSIPYHLIDVISPKKEFSVANWQELAIKAIEDVLSRDRLPIVCGGTGLYISALTQGYQFPQSKIKNQELRIKFDKLSLPELLAKLKKIDSETYKVIDKKNRRRVQRAVEIYYQSGKKSGRIKNKKPGYDFLILGLDFPKEVIAKKITQRLKTRLDKEGMVAEVRSLHKKGVSWKRLESFGLEYKFMSYYLRDKMSYEDAVSKLNTAIIQFAKRQRTWFRRNKNIHWINKYSEALKLIQKFIK